MTRPTFLSLFAGIGGLDLGLERAGWSCVGQVEIDPYCQRVLAEHWPSVPRWGDIKELHPDELPRADLVCAGFPCQPVSVAGRGLAQADERWLWPHVARLVRHLGPRWVLLENVPGLLGRGMGDVLGDLAACGYDSEWDCVPASAVGAPHQRDRVWIVAYPQGQPGALWPAERQRPGRLASGGLEDANSGAMEPRRRWRGTSEAGELPDPERVELWDQPGRRDGQGRSGQAVAGDDGTARALADPNGERQPQPEGPDRQEWGRAGNGSQPMADPNSAGCWAGSRLGWTRPPIERDGWWAAEPDMGRVAHGVPARLDRLRALGNAVVPQVAEHVGRLILHAEGVE